MKKIKVGAVGLGRLGKQHAENIAFKIPNAELTAVCSIVQEEVDEVVKAWGIPYGYTSFEEMLTNKELDAIAISSSSDQHCTHIKMALEAGFHVFCEKPLGTNLEELEVAQNAVDGHPDQVFMLGFMRRYDPSYAYAKEKIQEGAIGKPMVIRCYGLDPVSAIEGAIKFAPTSGGLFLDMMIHDIDLARWYLESEAKTVFAAGDCYMYPEFAESNDIDNGVGVVQFENGTIALMYAGRTAPHGYHVETEIIGTRGSLRIGTTPIKNLVTISNEHGVTKECVGGFLERFEQAYLNEMEEFIDCILTKRQPDVTVMDGVESTKLAYALTKSYRENELVRL